MVQFLRRLSRSAGRLLPALMCLACAVRAVAGAEADAPAPAHAVVADVGMAQLTLRQILETWEPARDRLLAQERAGRLTPAETEIKIREEWTQALESLVREELFYQEAEREFDRMIERHAEALADRGGRGQGARARSYYERELRERYQRSVERQISDFVEVFVRKAGGMAQLRKVIEQRGLSWEEWRERIRRRAFTTHYLDGVLNPDLGFGRVQPQPRPVDIRQYYREHQDEFVRPGPVTFRHILLSFAERGGEPAAKTAAGNVYQALVEQRYTFEEAARKFSDDTVSRERGGLEKELSTDIEREAWLGELREAARAQEPGELGSILITLKGCHLIQLVERGPDDPIDFREAQDEIRRRMQEDEREAATERLYRQLRERVRVAVRLPEPPSALLRPAEPLTGMEPSVPDTSGQIPAAP